MMPFAEKEIIDKLEDNLVHLAHVTTLLSNGDTPEQMLQQAFAGIEVDITGRKPVQYHCNCSRERVERVLLSIGEKDLKSLIDEGKDIELACQFCGKKYTFTPDEAAALLAADAGLSNRSIGAEAPAAAFGKTASADFASAGYKH